MCSSSVSRKGCRACDPGSVYSTSKSFFMACFSSAVTSCFCGLCAGMGSFSSLEVVTLPLRNDRHSVKCSDGFFLEPKDFLQEKGAGPEEPHFYQLRQKVATLKRYKKVHIWHWSYCSDSSVSPGVLFKTHLNQCLHDRIVKEKQQSGKININVFIIALDFVAHGCLPMARHTYQQFP